MGRNARDTGAQKVGQHQRSIALLTTSVSLASPVPGLLENPPDIDRLKLFPN